MTSIQNPRKSDITGLVSDVIQPADTFFKALQSRSSDPLGTAFTQFSDVIADLIVDLNDDADDDSLLKDITQALTANVLGLVGLLSLGDYFKTTSIATRAQFYQQLAEAVASKNLGPNQAGVLYDSLAALYSTINTLIKG